VKGKQEVENFLEKDVLCRKGGEREKAVKDFMGSRRTSD